MTVLLTGFGITIKSFIFMILFISFIAQSENKLIINTEVMVPYNYYSKNKEIVGINVDIVKSITKKINMQTVFHLYPWPRAYKNTLDKNNAGLISTARNANRENEFKWVGPLASGKGYLYKLKSRKDISVSSMADAKNYVIAAVRGDIYQTIFEELGFELEKNLVLFSYNAEYMKPFLFGKVDLILGSDLVLPYLLSINGSNVSQVEPVVKMPDTQGNYLALNKNVSDAVVNKLNKALIELKRSTEYQEIINKYVRN